MFRGHMRVGDVPLTVARRGEFSPQSFPPFEDENVVFRRERSRAKHTRRAAAYDCRPDFSRHGFIVPLLSHKVKFISKTIEFFFD